MSGGPLVVGALVDGTSDVDVGELVAVDDGPSAAVDEAGASDDVAGPMATAAELVEDAAVAASGAAGDSTG